MAKNGKTSPILNSPESAIDPRVWAVATEINCRMEALRKKGGAIVNIGKVTPSDMKFITKFMATGDLSKAAQYAFPNKPMNNKTHSYNTGAQTLERPLVRQTITEIMKEDEKFSDSKILDKAASLYYGAENETTSVAMFGHIAKIKGWNAPEKGINVNINRDIGSGSDEDLLATLDSVITGEEGNIHGEPHTTSEGGTNLSDELTS